MIRNFFRFHYEKDSGIPERFFPINRKFPKPCSGIPEISRTPFRNTVSEKIVPEISGTRFRNNNFGPFLIHITIGTNIGCIYLYTALVKSVYYFSSLFILVHPVYYVNHCLMFILVHPVYYFSALLFWYTLCLFSSWCYFWYTPCFYLFVGECSESCDEFDVIWCNINFKSLYYKKSYQTDIGWVGVTPCT